MISTRRRSRCPHTRRVTAVAGALVLVSCGGDSSGPEPAVATALRWLTQPTATQAGDVMATVRVEVIDAGGSRVTTATPAVTLSLESNPGAAALSGTTTVSASSGVAAFSGLSLDAPGSGFTLRATATGLTSALSSPFDITPDPAQVDGDSDGFTPAQGDCDDTDALVSPGAEDHPDGAWRDTNCDGIDGDESVAIFVSPTGVDQAGCGAKTSPCQTPQRGIDDAYAAGKRDVYIEAGTYANGALRLADGVSVYGGFAADWSRDGTDSTRIEGSIGPSFEPGASEAVVLSLVDVTEAMEVADLVLAAPDAIGTTAQGAGRSSYGFWIRNAPAGLVTLARLVVEQGDGASGATGSSGEDASIVSATLLMVGSVGGAGASYSTLCDDSSRGGGGLPGVNAGAGRAMNGGPGGNGGTMDADCSPPEDYSATAGGNGVGAAYTQSLFGTGGPAGPTCSGGDSGADGAVANGAPGSGGDGSDLVGYVWIARSGQDGGVGETGGGAGGGGGGAGGLAAVSGGGGGGGGGHSFGLYLIDASPDVIQSRFVRGTAGAGGAGGQGGRGQSGGAGGGGGPGTTDSGPGGDGGHGAHGGHGGGGGGGTGGSVAGIFRAGSSAPVLSANLFEAGTAGGGGAGGASALTAPLAEQDGNDGAAGSDGQVTDVLVGT